MPSTESLLDEIRKTLVETGTRSRLIHVNRSAKRGNFLNITDERSDDIFQLLRVDGRKMSFAGKGQEEDENLDDGITRGEIADEEFDARRYTDSTLETPLTLDALQKRLLRLFKDARTAEEEQGINILFLAMGFLRWYEKPTSGVLREAPLILLPVELVRNKETPNYNIECRDDDIVANLPLQERLNLDFGVSLPEIEDEKEWTPTEYFDAVCNSISGRERWEIDRNGMQLGFFSFAKLMMFRDLDPANWDKESLRTHALVSGLLADGFEPEPSLFKEDDALDDVLPPNQIFHVVDADSSQTKVIEEVRSGRNLVVQGPPGTGKSQTITNILAAAAHDNKKALFVAEKMAALEVVYKRMCKVGLKDLCLELHSRNANKKRFLQELAETILHREEAQPSELDTQALKSAQGKLNRVTKSLHTKISDRDYSPYSVLSSLVGLISKKVPPPGFDASALESISVPEESKLYERLRKYVDIAREHGYGEENPFYGTSKLNLQPPDLQRLEQELRAALENLGSWTNVQQELEERLVSEPILTLSSANNCKLIYQRLQNAPTESSQFLEIVHEHVGNTRFSEALSMGCDWVQHKERLSDTVTDSVWNQNLDYLRPALVKGVESWMSRFLGKYRSASDKLASYLKNEIPKDPKERLQILDSIIEGCTKRNALGDESEFLQSTFGEAWRGDRTPFFQIAAVTSWLKGTTEDLLEFSSEKLKSLIVSECIASFDSVAFDNRRERLESTLKNVGERLGLSDLSGEAIESLSLTTLQDRISRMLEGLDKYPIWTEYQFSKENLLAFPVEQLLEMLDQDKLRLDDAENELKYALNEARWKHSREVRSGLNELARLDRHDLVKTFKQHETRRVSEVQELIRDKHLCQIPQGAAGEMGLIRGESAKKRNHLPIRKLMQHASGMIQRIKPIFLMSPISVAQFLPPGKVEFDLLVIDEASQVRPADALGSIARAKQIVVVGDQKQLPPTSFFDRLTNTPTSEDEEGDESIITPATDMESVLSLCEARGLNESMLKWHYRSRHPSLITVSNIEFYRNRLILPPCPSQEDDDFGLKFMRVPGIYSSKTKGGGKPRTNKIEAEYVARRLQELAVSRPDCSVGIITFSKPQADMVTEILELKRREDSVLDEFLREDKNENVFVKNIENVQGDERDIILISVGYGPHEPNAVPSMRFGPINLDGGERRLNVLFTRSKFTCEVYTSFDPSDIVLTQTPNKGMVVLKKFLEFAKTGVLPESCFSRGDADSDFEEDVAKEVRDLGYEVEYQVGTAGFRIDLGVKNPESTNRYMLAIECDGANYHNALSARERDRLRQEILEGIGWHFHRIWSTDWFYRKEREVRRLKEALESAQVKDFAASLKGANDALLVVKNETIQNRVVESVILEETQIRVLKYTKAKIPVDANYEPHERPISEVCTIVAEVVDFEGPMHIGEVARRYADSHGKSKAGGRIGKRVAAGLSLAKKEGKLINKGKFWGTEEQFQKVRVRDRSRESPPTTSAESIPPDEIIACAALVEKECGIIEQKELIRVIAKTLGFKHAGSSFQSMVKEVLFTLSS